MDEPYVVVDTNVASVANGDADHADPECVAKCLEELETTRRHRIVLVDDLGLILDEYLGQRPHRFPRGPGDAFLIWIHDNQANLQHIRQVAISPVEGDPRLFAEFPNDPELAGFDSDDRKFVAVALGSGVAPLILNAADTDWWNHRTALLRNGARIEFLCPQMMATRAI